MTIAVLKRRGGDVMGDFWQVEVSAGHATISRGHVGKLHDDTEFVLLNGDIPRMMEGLAWAYRENRHALSPAERERILNIMTGD